MWWVRPCGGHGWVRRGCFDSVFYFAWRLFCSFMYRVAFFFALFCCLRAYADACKVFFRSFIQTDHDRLVLRGAGRASCEGWVFRRLQLDDAALRPCLSAHVAAVAAKRSRYWLPSGGTAQRWWCYAGRNGGGDGIGWGGQRGRPSVEPGSLAQFLVRGLQRAGWRSTFDLCAR